MLDIKLLRENIDEIAKRLARRGYSLDKEKFLQLESTRKLLQQQTQTLQNQRNTFAKSIGQAKATGEDIQVLLSQSAQLGEQLKIIENNLQEILGELDKFLLEIPNLPQESVPEGKNEEANQEIRCWGTPRDFDFVPKDHAALGEQLNLLDFNASAKITGARFVVMTGNLVKLHRALINFMIDVHTQEHGYQEIYVPYIVNRESLLGTGQLPKLEEDLFRVDSAQNFYLIPTGEVPVTNMARNTIFQTVQLPVKYVCHTPCFRSESGSYGKDTRGMIRQHQFEKVELVQLTTPEQSVQAHEALTHHAENILQKLNLPYRVMALCAGDLGFTASKTYDLEVWLPSQQKYREISSCSNTQAFQARRLQARYKSMEMKKPDYIHTLNGSGLAVGRTLVAVMENYQDAKGRIHIPEVLQPYMGKLDII